MGDKNCCQHSNNSLYYRGEWTITKQYYKYDMVTHDGSTYMAKCDITCNTDINNSSWVTIAKGITYKSYWCCNTVYQESNLVKYEDDIYICIKKHTSKIVPSESKCWRLFIPKGNDGVCPPIYNIKHMGEWCCHINYRKNHLVRYNSIVYICIENNNNKLPDSNNKYWELLVRDYKIIEKCCQNNISDVKYMGEWEKCTLYDINEIVRHNNASYISLCDNNSSKEPNLTNCIYWGLIAKDGNNNESQNECCHNESQNECYHNECCHNESQNQCCHNECEESKILYAVINKCVEVTDCKSFKKICKIKDCNIHIPSNSCNIIELKFNICNFNCEYYKIECDTTPLKLPIIKFNKSGYYRITYNISYISSSILNIYPYFDNDCCIYPGESKCLPSLCGDEGINNHTFYLSVNNTNCNKSFKIFLVNQNCTEVQSEIILKSKKCWLAIEYVGN